MFVNFHAFHAPDIFCIPNKVVFISCSDMGKEIIIFYLRHDTQHNDTQHYDSQPKDTSHDDIQHNDTHHNDIQNNDTQHSA